jgi:hypothetical protein
MSPARDAEPGQPLARPGRCLTSPNIDDSVKNFENAIIVVSTQTDIVQLDRIETAEPAAGSSRKATLYVPYTLPILFPSPIYSATLFHLTQKSV